MPRIIHGNAHPAAYENRDVDGDWVGQDVVQSLLQTLTDQGWVERKSEAVMSPLVESHQLGTGLTLFGSSAGHKVVILVEKQATVAARRAR